MSYTKPTACHNCGGGIWFYSVEMIARMCFKCGTVVYDEEHDERHILRWNEEAEHHQDERGVFWVTI